MWEAQSACSITSTRSARGRHALPASCCSFRSSACKARSTSPRQSTARRRGAVAWIMATLRGLLSLPLLDHLGWLGLGIIGVAILLIYLVARFWGSLLPYLAECGVAADSEAGMGTALLYLANILGATAGS